MKVTSNFQSGVGLIDHEREIRDSADQPAVLLIMLAEEMTSEHII